MQALPSKSRPLHFCMRSPLDLSVVLFFRCVVANGLVELLFPGGALPRGVGAGYFDLGAIAIVPEAETLALKGTTEEEQLH